MLGLRHSIAILFLAAASLVVFARQRFTSRALEDVSAPPARAAISPRVALVVVDGMRDDRMRSTMPRVRDLAEHRGALCSVLTPPITFTIAGVYTLGTGDAPSFALIPQNFEARSTRVDSVPAALGRVGGRTMLLGDPVWRDLFGHSALPGDAQRDLGPYAKHDDGGLARLGQAIEHHECELCVAHIGNFDAIGHRSGVRSAEYEAYASQVDAKIAELSRLDSRVTWLVTSDHGMFDSGGHGGDDPPARASFLAAWGPGIRHGACDQRLDQADIPTLMAVLLGAPIPFQSHGTVPAIAIVPDPGALDAELLVQKQTLARRLAERDAEGEPALETVASCRAVIATLEGTIPRAPMLLSIVPLLLVFVGMTRPSGLARPAKLRASWLLFVLALVAWSWIFSNAIYPRVSYTAAIVIAFTFALSSIAIAWLAATNGRHGSGPAVAVAVATVVAMETHFIAQLQALVLGLGSWLALASLRPRARVIAALGIGSAALGLVELGWLRVFALRATPHGAISAGIAALVTAFVLASSLPQDWPSARRRLVAIVTAITYVLVVTAPPFLRPWLPFAVIAALIALSAPRVVTLAQVAGAGFGVVVAMQCAPLYWCVLLATGWLGSELVSSNGIERVGARASPWVRGALLVAMAHVLTVLEGNRIRFEDVDVLVGFFGGAIDLHLPLTVALVAAYYAAPVVALVAFIARGSRPSFEPRKTLTAAAVLCLARVATILVGFVWGNLSEGSWTMQLTEVLLLSAWAIVLVLAVPMLAMRSRCPSCGEMSVLAHGAAE